MGALKLSEETLAELDSLMEALRKRAEPLVQAVPTTGCADGCYGSCSGSCGGTCAGSCTGTNY